ncbi:MAG: nitroreductase family protein [Gammaproteobacteria bacterium]|nr:nitroreductase family protein [Gammaproteobacteria bacterium]NNJ97968.1 nitroreductase family protein [Gammaproteobacteria bacterium]
MTEKKANTRVEIDPLIAARWSPQAFDPERVVDSETVMALLEAAHWAPSCYNEQPWRFIVCNRHDNEVAWQFALSCLMSINQLWAKNASLLIVACASEVFSHNGNSNRWAQYDTGAASMNICLQATSLGLFAHQMGGFDAERAREIFKLPQELTPMSVIAVGYYGDIEAIEAGLVAGETAARERKPLESHFFRGDLETPYVF